MASSTPCKAFGHTEGRYKSGDCRGCAKISVKKYRATPNGALFHKRSQARFRTTLKGKASKKTRNARYANSFLGLLSRMKDGITRRRIKHTTRLQEILGE